MRRMLMGLCTTEQLAPGLNEVSARSFSFECIGAEHYKWGNVGVASLIGQGSSCPKNLGAGPCRCHVISPNFQRRCRARRIERVSTRARGKELRYLRNCMIRFPSLGIYVTIPVR